MGFTRNVEDFTCAHCGTEVQGTGYTNHCPMCLWSKHVDVDPGDRAANCGGMMEPASLEGSSPDYVITHLCQTCGFRRRNRVATNDDAAALLAVVRKATA